MGWSGSSGLLLNGWWKWNGVVVILVPQLVRSQAILIKQLVLHSITRPALKWIRRSQSCGC